VDLYYNTEKKLPPKDINPEALTKASQLNITDWFDGETIYITFDNGTIGYYPSTYKYNSINNISHQLSIFINFPYAPGAGHQNITIAAPLHWNLTYLDPVETYRYCTTCSMWEFNFTQGVDTTYNITFFSGGTYGVDYARQNQYLAIDDNSDDFFEEPGFESIDYLNDWIERADPRDFAINELNSTVYFAGNSSLFLSDSGIGFSKQFLSKIDNGFYYISVVILITSYTQGSIDLTYYNEGFQDLVLCNTSVLNKWQRFFGYIEINGSTLVDGVDTNLILNLNVGTASFFIDEFRFWQSNPTMENDATIYQYNVSSSLITWDLYNGYGVNATTVNYDIRVTTGDNSINTTSQTSNPEGYSSYIYVNSTLDISELEIEVNNTEGRYYNRTTYITTNQSSLITPIQLSTSTVTVKKATAEFWFSSENDTFTYSYTIYSATSTTTDLTHITKAQNGLHNLTYIVYLDSNSESLFIPSPQATTTIYLKVPEVEGLGNLLKILIGVIPLLIIFLVALFLPIYFIYRVLIRQ
jgi:hypothetical protein